jgi:hypothetical protein
MRTFCVNIIPLMNVTSEFRAVAMLDVGTDGHFHCRGHKSAMYCVAALPLLCIGTGLSSRSIVHAHQNDSPFDFGSPRDYVVPGGGGGRSNLVQFVIVRGRHLFAAIHGLVIRLAACERHEGLVARGRYDGVSSEQVM